MKRVLTRTINTPIIPDSFLGGSAPRLQLLNLLSFAYLALLKLLSSATGLVSLYLFSETSCISPQIMVDCLASLTRLEKLRIESLDWSNEGRLRQHPPPLTRRTDSRLFPMLATLLFAGLAEYFDHLFTRIYAPRLEDINTEFHGPIIFDLSRIFLFTGLKETFEALDQAYMGIETSVLITSHFPLDEKQPVERCS